MVGEPTGVLSSSYRKLDSRLTGLATERRTGGTPLADATADAEEEELATLVLVELPEWGFAPQR